MIAAKGQVEHTKSERSILCEIHHPYIVCLRYAFQSEDKLYLITDYYNGGSLFYHLRKSRGFSENRARFYAAQLCLALSHLHEHHIIYRDLKLEVSASSEARSEWNHTQTRRPGRQIRAMVSHLALTSFHPVTRFSDFGLTHLSRTC